MQAKKNHELTRKNQMTKKKKLIVKGAVSGRNASRKG